MDNSDNANGEMMDNFGCFAIDESDKGTDKNPFHLKLIKACTSQCHSSLLEINSQFSLHNCSQVSPVCSHSPIMRTSTTVAPQTAIPRDWNGAPPRPGPGTTIL